MSIFSPPRIEVCKDGKAITTLPLFPNDVTVTIGRHQSCKVRIGDEKISRLHASLVLKDNSLYIADEDSSNKTWLNGEELRPHQQYLINKNSIVKLAHGVYSLRIRFPQEGPGRKSSKSSLHQSEILDFLQKKGSVLIGRDKNCDIVLTSLLVSRKHAVIEKRKSAYYIRDLSSKNGVFVNGKRVIKETSIGRSDRITVGPADFILNIGEVRTPYAIVANNIRKVYGQNIGLQYMSLKIPSRKFVALMGPSGCGKSTLLKGLNGDNPVTNGSVMIGSLKLNQENLKVLKSSIGYVPQDDIVHSDLTLAQTMYFAAKLRIAEELSDAEIEERINEVLRSLNIADPDLREKKISELSGGQRKRASIAVELLSDPTILFLDEPTSPLDPETIEDFLNCIRDLTRKGRGKTVIMVTHKPSDLSYVDKVIFLSKGGYHAFYGNKEDLLPYFDKKDIIEIYSELKTVDSGKKWYDRWREEHVQSEEYFEAESLIDRSAASVGNQFYWLSRRYLQIKLNDGFNLAILLLQPVVIGILIGLIFNDLQTSVLFLMAISAIWFGVSNASKEIVGEIPIYRRERMFNLNIIKYICSKLAILSIIALIQSIAFVLIIYCFYASHPDHLTPFKGLGVSISFLFFLSFSATIMGLMLSAAFKTTEKVMSIVPIALIPQIMLAGVIATIDEGWKHLLSYFVLGRWGTEGFCHIQDDLADNGEGVNVLYAHVMQTADASAMQDSTAVAVAMPDSSSSFIGNSIGPDSMVTYNAIEYLRFYDTVAWDWSDSLSANFMAILALDVLLFLLLYWFLKQRDNKFN